VSLGLKSYKTFTFKDLKKTGTGERKSTVKIKSSSPGKTDQDRSNTIHKKYTTTGGLRQVLPVCF